MAKTFNAEKYMGQWVEIVTLEPSSSSHTVSKGEEGSFVHEGTSNADNLASGDVIEVTDKTITIKYEQRSRMYTQEIFIHSISSINTSELTESGKERAEAARARFTGVVRKKKSSKEKEK